LTTRAWSGGDRSVEQFIFSLVLPDLHTLARLIMRGERGAMALRNAGAELASERLS